MAIVAPMSHDVGGREEASTSAESAPSDDPTVARSVTRPDGSFRADLTDRPLTSAERRRAKRLAYWNRPKPPKDWRYWVGGTGRVLIITGLLLFAFVGYQLWGTGIEQARAQRQLQNEFEERQTELGTVPVLIPATTPAPAPTAPGDSTAPTTPPTTLPPTLSLPPIAEEDVLARMTIPRIGMENQKVVAGVSVDALKKGPGHFPQTPVPGELGNAAIAGHRTTYGGPFLHLDELDPGDEIIVENLYGQQFIYIVTGTEVVSPGDGHVINTTDPNIATLTLVTCTPVRTSKQRLIIYAELDLARSPAPTAASTFYGQGEGEPVSELPPGDELPAEDTSADTSAEAVDSTAAPSTDSTAAPSTDAATTTPPATDATPATSAGVAETDESEPPRPEGFSSTDPFSQGWFSDSAAWPQVALWGFALVALCLGAYVLARSLQRRWVGWVAPALPFVVLLYFFFQNVNRLLPPGL